SGSSSLDTGDGERRRSGGPRSSARVLAKRAQGQLSERESFPARNAERSGSSSLDTGDGERRRPGGPRSSARASATPAPSHPGAAAPAHWTPGTGSADGQEGRGARPARSRSARKAN